MLSEENGTAKMVVDVLASALSDLLFLGQAASTTAAAASTASATASTTTVAPPPEATLEEELPGHVVGEGNCSSNCSGRGICVDGECYCEVRNRKNWSKKLSGNFVEKWFFKFSIENYLALRKRSS